MTIYSYSGRVQSSHCTTLFGREPTVTDPHSDLTLARVRPFRSQVRTYRCLYSSYIIKVWLTYIAVVIIITTKYPASARLKTLVGMQQCVLCYVSGNEMGTGSESRQRGWDVKRQIMCTAVSMRLLGALIYKLNITL